MELIQPGIGLIFWMLLTFLLLFWALRRFAWPTILRTLNEREASISSALGAAEKAREEIKNLQVDNDRLLREARLQSDEIIRQATSLKQEILGKAQNEARKEYDRILENARQTIENERMAAITELRLEVGKLSIDIAEKILRKEMENKARYQEVIDHSIDHIKLKS